MTFGRQERVELKSISHWWIWTDDKHKNIMKSVWEWEKIPKKENEVENKYFTHSMQISVIFDEFSCEWVNILIIVSGRMASNYL